MLNLSRHGLAQVLFCKYEDFLISQVIADNYILCE